MNILKKIYLILHIIISFFTIIFLFHNVWDWLNAKFSYSLIIIVYNALNAALGIFLHIKNCRNKRKFNFAWQLPFFLIFTVGAAYLVYLFEILFRYIGYGSFEWDIFGMLIPVIITFLGQALWEKEMILSYDAGVLLKIYFSLITPIAAVMPMLQVLAIMTW